MSYQIALPPNLRQLAGDQDTITITKEAGATPQALGDIINEIEVNYPGIKDRIVVNGELRKFVIIYIEDADARAIADDEKLGSALLVPVPDGSHLSIVPAYAGG